MNRREGMTLAFSQKQARAVLDKPDQGTVLGLRDRAILSVGLQVGFRRSEIASLKVGDLHEKWEKGKRERILALFPPPVLAGYPVQMSIYCFSLRDTKLVTSSPFFRRRINTGPRRFSGSLERRR